MTKEELATQVLAHMEAIRNLYRQFNPTEFENGNPYFSLAIINDTIMFNNNPEKDIGGPKIHYQKTGDNEGFFIE